MTTKFLDKTKTHHHINKSNMMLISSEIKGVGLSFYENSKSCIFKKKI